ncbi:type VI secretion system membrane subunit TssM [Cronobacter sakazakii]|uniref:type VI secretion system membrane subunit TssM n=1 Tax=Cronobacter sakazakii TaxID=28141 RepID=UPI0011E3FC3F|nr:type VI secretion system membrane subunit TssM [Cronobacter sakazakii]MDT3611079.1 type VI secretion system membrane subunit TssM [Cronobacter sakazakii]QWR80195.1 type VI secretion system membrane subunit TssM [Cronobacter sakazakii]TYD48624.1 type VI secretion system membrane subunit TssM [Cronobacter sakazakii]
MLNILLSIVTNRILWGFMGVTALSAVVWMIGPLLSIVDSRPLESETNRIISIALIYLIWVHSHIVPRLYNAWLNRKLMDKLNEGKPAEEGGSDVKRLGNDDKVLADRFDEAAQILKKAHFNAPGQRGQWTQRFSTQYLYQLPWYVIIGAPGSGKTTALVNSGLQFPLADRFGKTALRGIGGTRNCDWWFTNEAVLLDTAGRYTTQESEQAQDAGEWLSFVDLLRKYRRRQPINGVIITISVSDLLTQSPEATQQQAVNLRQRLAELHEQLGIRFPVYVLVTKADLLKGFRSYFGRFDKAQRDQIWGFTFPWDRSKQADFDLLGAFTQEFALLQQRLDAGLPDTLLAESDPKARAECYLFPQEFAALRPLLADYLSTVFARSNFETEFSPRGIYLASGTQEGLPFDRVMGELNRALSLPSGGKEGDNWDSVSKEAPIPGGKGQSFFIKNLLQNVIFQEAGIAGQNRWWELRNRAVLWSGYAALIALLVVLGGLWLTSYGNNKDYLAEVNDKVPGVERQSKALQTTAGRDLFSMLPFFNSLVDLPKSKEFDLNSPPVTYRMGLYRGDDVNDASQALYQKALQEMLMPAVAQLITGWVRSDNGSDVEYSYEALKAYQMLYQPKHYDGKFLHSWVMLNLERNLPQNVTQAQLNQLEWHLTQLLEPQIQTSPYAKDESLISRQQAMINQKPLSLRVYGRLKRLLERDENLKPVSLATLGGPQSELVFSRKSGKPVSDGVPGLYTPKGYWESFNGQIDNVTASLHDDDTWVLGLTTAQEDKTQTDNAVRQLYMRDFISQWDSYLADIQLNNSADLNQRINTARVLSSSNSPLRRLVMNLSQVLTLSRAEPQAGEAQAKEQGNRATRTLEALFSDRESGATTAAAAPQTPEQVVTDHYAPIIELAQPLEKGGKTIVFDDFIKQIDELYRYLTAVQDAANSGMPPPGGEAISRLQASAGRLPGGLQNMFSRMAVGASSDTQQRELENVRKRISVEVGSFCRQAIAGRYPLVRSASSEVTPDDLARMFAPGTGLMDSFFRDNLTNKVDTTQQRWRFTPGIDGKTLPGSEGVLRPFQQAQYIRDAFFANGATTPSYRVTVRTVRMDNDILTLSLDVDGQLLRYSHGPQAVQLMSWPGSGGTNQVRMQLGLANGTTSTLVTNGAWALNRFFDRARIAPGAGSLSRQATFSVDGHSVTLEFTPNSIRNPFQLPGFACP